MYKLSVAAPSRLTTDRKKYKQLKYTIKSDHSDGRRKFAWGLLFLFLFLLLATAVWIILRFHAQITRQDQELQKREGGTILITHESEMAAIADHVIRIEGGELYYEK